MAIKIKESQIQKQIVDYLSLNSRRYGFCFFSIPNEGFMLGAMHGMPKEKRCAIINHLKKMGMVAGMPDIAIVYRGQIYFIELKKRAKDPSAQRQAVYNWLEENDAVVEIVTSVEEVEDFLREFGIIK